VAVVLALLQGVLLRLLVEPLIQEVAVVGQVLRLIQAAMAALES
jgi:hypothetical protein